MFHANKLSVNIDKINDMVYKFHQFRNNLDNFAVIVDGKELKKLDSCKFLGICFDTDLNWKQHIMYISNKISKTIGILKRVRYK